MLESDVVKRLLWSALLAGIGALMSVAGNKIAAIIWARVFDEEPPER